jgi:hypothetical protein
MPSWQTIYNWAAGVFGIVLTGAATFIAFWFRRYIDKVDALERVSHEYIKDAELAQRYASQLQMVELEKRIADLVSRKELLAHLEELAEQRQINHQDNVERLERNGEDIREVRRESGETHKRIDDIFKLLMRRHRDDDK